MSVTDQEHVPPDHSALGRRSVLRGLVAGGAAVATGGLLAACGSDDGSVEAGDPASSTPTPTETTSGGGGEGGEVLVATAEVPEGGGVVLEDAEIVVTRPAAGEYAGFSSICTHAGCSVSEVVDGTINCPCHGSQFSIEDGSVVAGPAPSPLPPVEVTVDGDSVVRA